ncbi:protoporphyrinogen oxidase [Microbacterium mangrovi]|uniref:Protoporphyrinogen oxidase n=1 Tax=Microbacterium mangrovi TaxID=1348253 RepID=A0A0B2A898_9MICO|nr:FAD-dependent oxidoreductase [Microbacterium mangrovi]KHK99798.1 protoporphyrinogen oxidase [Microbacterium mangrovi]
MTGVEGLPDLEGLTARVHETRVAVIGGGMAGLVAALEFAKVGLSVTVFEADDHLGGTVRSAVVAGVTVDVGAESYATRGGTVRALVDELGLGDAVVTPSAGGAWVAGLAADGKGPDAAPLPTGGVLGIPANPWDPAVVRIIGRKGAWRAYLDRLRPPLTIGVDRSLGHLVRGRMGEAVLDKLVAPVTSGVYSARPDDIDVELAAPGLSAALTRAGSLSGAVGNLRAGAAAKGAKAPGSAVEGIEGGMFRLVEAIRARLEALEVDLRTAAPVAALERDGEKWRVVPAAAPSAEIGESAEIRIPEPEASESDAILPRTVAEQPFDAVIVATPEAVARQLLAPHAALPTAAPTVPPVVEIVTLVVDAPALDAAPRGTGVLTVPGSHTAKALTHSTAKWEWVRAAAGGAHVVRVSFGAQGEAPATEGLDDEAAARLAASEASALLGVDLGAVRGLHRARFVQSQPASVLGRAEYTGRARAAITRVAGLGAAGAWLSGTGLAQVVPDAAAEADRVRAALLWGRSEGAAE